MLWKHLRETVTALVPRYRANRMSTSSERVATGLKLSQFGDGQMRANIGKEFKIDDKAILLSKVKGKIFATTSKCTHYGAPLSKGVLASDGRLTCPWHGACFNVTTGDIEDAPGLDGLFAFKVEINEDQIYVDVDKTKLKQTRKPKFCKAVKSKTFGNGVVIVGGGAGSNAAAQALREAGYDGKVTVLSAEDHMPIDRTKLSKSLVQDPSKIALRDQYFFAERDIEFRTGVTVTSIDPAANAVELEGGERVGYEHLIVATGGKPKRLPLDGVDLQNVFVLRQIPDVKAINVALGDGSNKKNLCIVGSSFIGMELAAATASKANVRVVGQGSIPFAKLLGETIGSAIKKKHESNGVKFHMGAELSHFEPSSHDPSAVGAIVLKDGTKIDADLVVLGVGVSPATEILKGHVELNKDGSVDVDEHFKIQGIPGNVYAIGDIARYIDGNTGNRFRIEHWNVASNHGRAVAQNIAGPPIKSFKKVPIFWSAQGTQLRFCGTSEQSEWDDIIIRGNPDELKFSAFYAKGDRIVAVCTSQTDPVMTQCSELFRLGAMPSATDLRNGKDVLSITLTDVA